MWCIVCNNWYVEVKTILSKLYSSQYFSILCFKVFISMETTNPGGPLTLCILLYFVVQLLSHVDSVAPWTAACQASLSFTISWSLLRFMSIESVMTFNHLILCCPLLLQSSIFPSIRVFSNESVLRIRWPKYWSFSFSVSPSKKYSGLISFRIDWLNIFALQETLKNILQHHNLKASILWHSAFFMVQFSYP